MRSGLDERSEKGGTGGEQQVRQTEGPSQSRVRMQRNWQCHQ